MRLKHSYRFNLNKCFALQYSKRQKKEETVSLIPIQPIFICIMLFLNVSAKQANPLVHSV